METDGGLKIFVNGEEIDLDLGDIKKMLHEHAGELEGHLSMLELDDLNIEKMMKGANMLVGEFGPKDAEFFVQKELSAPPKVMIGITMDDISPRPGLPPQARSQDRHHDPNSRGRPARRHGRPASL